MHQQTFNLTINPPSGGSFTLNLLGGWRINQPFCKGGLAIDFATLRAWTTGHSQYYPRAPHEYQLPAMGAGADLNAWPWVNETKNYGNVYTVPGWNHSSESYCCGMMFRDGLLWMSGKGWYVGNPAQSAVVQKFSLGATATLVDTITYSNRGIQAFGGGFIKGHPSGVIVGCGGYESGQGSTCGPCYMWENGTIINEFPEFSSPVSLREKRSPNYNTGTTDPNAWLTGPINAEGYWFASRVWGGGLYLNGKYCFWVQQGYGQVDYAYQNETFTQENGWQSQEIKLYKYGPSDHFGVWEDWPVGNTIAGQDIDGDKIYLLATNAWQGDLPYNACPAIYCYQVV